MKRSTMENVGDEEQPLLRDTREMLASEPLVCFSVTASDSRSETASPIMLPDLLEDNTPESVSSSKIHLSDDSIEKLMLNPLHNENHRPLSNFETMIHLLKGNIGTGIFAIPDAFKNAGLAVGSVGIPLMALFCVHCMHILVKCASIMKERKGTHFMDYADVVETACLTGPEKFVKYAGFSRKLINTFLCLTQFGFCCVYIVFVATNLEQVVTHYFPSLVLDLRIWMAILTVPLIFLCWIRKLKYLSPVSLISNTLQSASLVLIFYYLFQDLPPVESRPAFGSLSKLPLYFGTAVFAFEGISLVLPLQKNMRTPQDFRGWNGVLNTGMIIVTVLYFAVGFYGYLKYGEDIKGSITLNLPSGDILAQIVKLMMALAIFGSYAVQYFVPIEIMWPTVSTYFHTSRSKLVAEYTFRASLVVMTFVLAAIIPKLDLFISLVGAFSSSFLALIFPPLLELITFWPRASKWMIAKDVIIIIFGLIGFLTGTYASVESIMSAFSTGH